MDESDHRAIEFVFGRLNYERAPDAARTLQDFRLGRMEELLDCLGNPQQSIPTVHVAGSKGKGSTATMIARIAEAAGGRVGLFTSPHISRFDERMTINGACPPPGTLARLMERLRPRVAEFDARGAESQPTFFELTTALAWLYFQDFAVDLAVVEVGLGGRLDATNVCRPLVSVITSISLDHTRLLGQTTAAIAREKAGIIKPGVPVVSGVREAGAATVIREIAAQQGAPLLELSRDFHAAAAPAKPPPFDEPPKYRFDYRSPHTCWEGLEPAMPGAHQADNGALAVAAAQLLADRGFPITEASVRAGLSAARCPLRIEVAGRRPLIIVDAAHNPASMEALCRSLDAVSAGRRIAVFASSRDKEIAQSLAALNSRFEQVILTQYVINPRAVSLPELEELARATLTCSWSTAVHPAEALDRARALAGEGDLIVVTGSFFLAAEAIEALRASSPVPEPAGAPA